MGTEEYAPPDFCIQCAKPFPWVSRQGRSYELMNLLDDEQLDPATELEVPNHSHISHPARTAADGSGQMGRVRR
jgi:hypothetical protein